MRGKPPRPPWILHDTGGDGRDRGRRRGKRTIHTAPPETPGHREDRPGPGIAPHAVISDPPFGCATVGRSQRPRAGERHPKATGTTARDRAGRCIAPKRAPTVDRHLARPPASRRATEGIAGDRWGPRERVRPPKAGKRGQRAHPEADPSASPLALPWGASGDGDRRGDDPYRIHRRRARGTGRAIGDSPLGQPQRLAKSKFPARGRPPASASHLPTPWPLQT